MSKSYYIETIQDLVDIVTDENVDLLKHDIGEYLDYVLAMRFLSPVMTVQPKFRWNDDGVKGVKTIHIEVEKDPS